MDKLVAMQTFIRVVELGSFSKAAADLGVGQPSVTKQIAQLEKHLGSRLLHRTTQGVSVTEVGALYAEHCRRIAHEVEEADHVALQAHSQMQGQLRISTSVAFGRRVLAPLLLKFIQEHPQLQIDLSCEDRHVNLLEQGVDVAIRMGRLADSTLGSRYLGSNPWVLVGSGSYLKARGTPRSPDELRGHAALIYSTVQGDARWSFTRPQKSGDTQRREVVVHGPLRSNNLSALLTAARGGLGLAVLPLYVAHDSIRNGAVQVLLKDWLLPAQEMHAVYPSPRLVPTKVQLFVSWLQGQFGDAWWTRAP
ncbi:MAG: LysR family transcriptional regulator [Betaproteobacteria bacterium]|jgi:DNA-binding transcriptional LysR family regulator